MKFKIVEVPSSRHGGTRALSSLTAIILHETEGFNGGDYAVLSGSTARNVSVHFWIPDYNDPGAAKYIKDGVHHIYQFLPLNTIGWSVGVAKPGYGNAETISIELGNYSSEKYGEAQLCALDWLIAHIDHELGRELPLHSHAWVALPKGRKSDPGRSFPMHNYVTWRAHGKPKVYRRIRPLWAAGYAKPDKRSRVLAHLLKGTRVEVLGAVTGGRVPFVHIADSKGRLMWVGTKTLK